MATKTDQHIFEYKLQANEAIESAKQLIKTLDKYNLGIKNTTGSVKKLKSSLSAMVEAEKNMSDMAKKSMEMSAKMKSAFNSASTSVTGVSLATSIAAAKVKAALVKWVAAINPIPRAMEKLKNMPGQVFPTMVKLLSSVGQAYRRVSKNAKENLTIQNAFKVALKGVNAGLNIVKTGFNSVISVLQKFKRSTSEAITNSKLLSTVTANLGTAFKAIIGFKISEFFAQAASEAINFAETLNLFNTIMDESIESANEFVDSVQEMYGLDPATIMQISAEFYNLESAIEAPTAAAEKMSLGLTNVALNLASLHNMDISKVAENLNSGMQGMTRAVRKYGIDLRMATLETTALAYGLDIDASTTSEANRQALRYLTIVRQARVATGDFAKTIESPANQLRILKEQIIQLARALGNLFLPAIQAVLPYINGFVMAIRTLLEFLGTLLGISSITFGGMTDSAKELDSSLKSAGTSTDKLKKKVKQLTAPFDELNVLQEDTSSNSSSGSGSGSSDLLDPTLAKALEETSVKLEEVRMKANDVRDSILNFLGFSWNKEGKLTFDASQLEKNLINKFPSWTQTITAVFDNWDGIAAGFVAVWDALGTSILSLFSGIVQGFTNMIQAFNLDQIVADWITQLPGQLQAIADWLNNNQALFVTMGEIIAYVGTAFAAWKIISPILGLLGQLSGVVAAITSPIGILVTIIAALALGFIEAYNNSSRFREILGQIKDSAGELWESIKTLLGSLWEVLQPVFEQIGSGLTSLWNDIVAPLLGNTIDLILEVLQVATDILNWILETCKPFLVDALQIIVDIIDGVIRTICGILDGVIQAAKGIIEFIDGVFKQDWDQAWGGIKDIFKGVANFLISCFEGAVNGIIDLINLLLSVVFTAVESFVNMLLDGVEWIINLIPGVEVNIPTITAVPKISHIQVPRLAEGGVVDSPTLSMIGEGRYPEAVIPLGDSPQMKNLVQQIADKLDSTSYNDDTPIQVNMYLNDQVLYKSVQRVSRERGVDFKMGAFQR